MSPTWGAWQTTSSTCKSVNETRDVYPQTYYAGSGTWTSALQQAVNTASASVTKTVFLKNGIYTLDQQLWIPDGVNLIGESRNGAVVSFRGNGGIYIMTGSGTALQHLTVDCNNVPQSSGILIHGFDNDFKHDVRVSDVHVQNCPYQGISLQYAHNAIVDSVETNNNGNRGINVSAFSHDNIFRNISGHENAKTEVLFGHGSYNNTLSDSVLSDSYMAGIWIHTGAHGNTVRNVTIRSPHLGEYVYGVVLWDTYDNVLTDIIIEGFKHGVLVRASDQASELPIIPDNTTRNALSNIVITGDRSSNAVGVELNVLKSTGGRGQFYVIGNTFSNISANNVTKIATAVSEMNTSSDIHGNTFQDMTTSAPYDFGLYTDNTWPQVQPPSGLAAVCTGGNVQLSWTPVTGATSYGIRIHVPGSSDFQTLVNWFTGGTAYTASVVPGTTYEWWIHANNSTSNLGAYTNGPMFTCQ